MSATSVTANSPRTCILETGAKHAGRSILCRTSTRQRDCGHMTLICITTANTTAYDCLHGTLCMAGAELQRLGHEVEYLNLSTPGWSERLKALISERPEMIGM